MSGVPPLRQSANSLGQPLPPGRTIDCAPSEGNSPNASPPALVPIPGQVTLEQLAQLEATANDLRCELEQQRRRLAGISTAIKRARASLGFAVSVAKFRRFADQSLGRIGITVLSGALLGGAAALVLVFADTLVGMLLAAIAGAVIGAGLAALALFEWSDQALNQFIEARREGIASLLPLKEAARRQVDDTIHSYTHAADRHAQFLQVYFGRRHQLLTCNWSALAGIPFESFLADVFRELGYEVETTKASGDQGVDLVISRGGRRIAVQAKGYPGSTVGNKAIQEAHAGMTFYGCHASAVITNSTFTSGAVQLAQAVNCALIDGKQIPDLIYGRLVL